MLHSRVASKASPTIIRLGCKGLQGTNTLAYYKNRKLRTEKVL
jgi:hypothetical protein